MMAETNLGGVPRNAVACEEVAVVKFDGERSPPTPGPSLREGGRVF